MQTRHDFCLLGCSQIAGSIVKSSHWDHSGLWGKPVAGFPFLGIIFSLFTKIKSSQRMLWYSRNTWTNAKATISPCELDETSLLLNKIPLDVDSHISLLYISYFSVFLEEGYWYWTLIIKLISNLTILFIHSCVHLLVYQVFIKHKLPSKLCQVKLEAA